MLVDDILAKAQQAEAGLGPRERLGPVVESARRLLAQLG